jgi:hypothetical protein
MTRRTAWIEALEQIEQSLGQFLAAVPDPPPGEPAAADGPPPWQDALRRLEEHQTALQAGTAAAAGDAAAVEELLAAAEGELQGWLAASTAVRGECRRRAAEDRVAGAECERSPG